MHRSTGSFTSTPEGRRFNLSQRKELSHNQVQPITADKVVEQRTRPVLFSLSNRTHVIRTQCRISTDLQPYMQESTSRCMFAKQASQKVRPFTTGRFLVAHSVLAAPI